MGIILITGGSRGIGAATVRECIQRGYRVVFTYKTNEAAAAHVAKTLSDKGDDLLYLPLDFDDVRNINDFVKTLREQINAKWGSEHLAAIVNNAGAGGYELIEKVSVDAFDSMLNVHLKGPFFLTQALLPYLERNSSVINITSATTRVATPGVAPYACFKGALEVLTRYMAKKFADRGVRVNAVSPGAIRTELGGGLNAEFEQFLASQTALGRIGEAEEVASVIATLIGSNCQWVTAQSVEVSGGYII